MIVSRETYIKLKRYEELLIKWQKTINLISASTIDNIWERHIEDSLQIIPHLSGTEVLDVGSGGGFPGMVIAICENFNVTCVDSDSRKMLFLSEIARELNVKITIITDRVENIKKKNYDIICARGFASLHVLLNIVTINTLSKKGVFLKGANFEEEIKNAKNFFSFNYNAYVSSTNEKGRIVTVDSVQKKQ